MVVFPPAKINLGLHVIAKRADGYHNIESVLVPIPLHDVLEVIVDRSLSNGVAAMTRSGIPVPGDPENDLCLKAVKALGIMHPLPGLRIHLHKAIPIGAGLGGGSSDGAHMLLAINELLDLDMSRAELQVIAAELGSDCPFFLDHHAQLATGRGETLKRIEPRLKGWWLLLIAPGVHVSTAEVYAHTRPSPTRVDLENTLGTSSPERWSENVINDMERYVLSAHPAVAPAKQALLDAGAVYASMSGSGSSVFGLFTEQPGFPALPAGQQAWVMRL